MSKYLNYNSIIVSEEQVLQNKKNIFYLVFIISLFFLVGF